MKPCIVCGVNKPELPDRNSMGRPIKKVCRPCHQDRLTGDLQKIMERRKSKALQRDETKICTCCDIIDGCKDADDACPVCT